MYQLLEHSDILHLAHLFIFHTASYGCDTSSLTPRDEHRWGCSTTWWQDTDLCL